jgi:hypothetical protein
VTEPRESFLSKLGLAVVAPVLVILLAGGSSNDSPGSRSTLSCGLSQRVSYA